MAVDINNKNFSYTVLTPEGDILKQGYLGQKSGQPRFTLHKDRAILQSLRALKELKRMKHKQRNFVYTNIGQMVRDMIRLAVKFDADISIEKLRADFNRKEESSTRNPDDPFVYF